VDEIFNLLTHKLIWLAALAIAGTLFVIFRRIHFQIERQSYKNIIQTIQKDTATARAYRDTLDIPYGAVSCAADQVETWMTRIRSLRAAGAYQIEYVYALTPGQILVFTTLSFIDFDIGISGSAADTAKTAHHNFLLTTDSGSGNIKIFSALYTNTTEKFQKEAFAAALTQSFKGLDSHF